MFALSQCDAATRERVLALLAGSPDVSFAPDPSDVGCMVCTLSVPQTSSARDLLAGAASLPVPPSAPLTAPPRSLGWLLKLTDEIVNQRLKFHQAELASLRNAIQRYKCNDPHCDEFSTFVFTFLTKKFGLDPIVRRTCSDLLACLKAYRGSDIETQIFGLLVCSKQYDAVDTLFYCIARSIAMPHSFAKVDALGPGAGSVTRRYIWEQHVPLILKACCRDMPASFARAARSAVRRWHDVQGRLPGLIADPNFYTPPFMDTHPYLGRADDATATLDCGGYYQQSEKAMELHQLLMLLLINFHHDRTTTVAPPPPQQPPPTHTAPALAAPTVVEVPLDVCRQLHESYMSVEEDLGRDTHGHRDPHGPLPPHPMTAPPAADVYKGFEQWLTQQNKTPQSTTRPRAALPVAAPVTAATTVPPRHVGPDVTTTESLLEREISELEKRLKEAGDDLRKLSGVY